MTITGFKAIGGKINQKALTNKLQKENEKEYSIGKVVFWLKMINDMMKPVRWNKPTKNGTAVKFEYIHYKETYEIAMGELKGFIKHVNDTYDLDLTLTDEK